jgi:hypothetical protein
MLYKQLFSHPEIVRDLVAGFLSADWARGLPVDAFERVNASYASDGGKARPDKWMALRMQVYVGLLYHGRRPWTSATELSQLMLAPPAGLERFQANQQYMLLDRHHDSQRGDIVSLLFRLLHAQTGTEMRAAVDLLAERVRQDDMAPARDSLKRWIQLTLQDASGLTSMDLEEEFAMKTARKFTTDEMFSPEIFDRPIREAAQKASEEGRLQGLQEGRQAGMQEGMQEGELLALRMLLGDLLAGKDVPSDLSQKISAANARALRAAIKALAGGASPRQLFAEG